ncbi:MAG: hypothetical protein ACKPJJ_34880, partial [Planctomycetaceae bacterium]
RVGHKVIELERIALGPISLGSLPYGRFRELHGAEIRELKRFLATGELTEQSRGRGSFGYRPGKTRNKRRRTAPGGKAAPSAGRTAAPRDAGGESSGTRRSRGQQSVEAPRGRRSVGPSRAAQGPARAAQGSTRAAKKTTRGGQTPRGPRSQQAAASKNRNRRRP